MCESMYVCNIYPIIYTATQLHLLNCPMVFIFSCRSNEAGKLIRSEPIVDSSGKETFSVQAFKFNHNNAISVKCSVRYCPPGFKEECKVIFRMYLVAKGSSIFSGGSKEK